MVSKAHHHLKKQYRHSLQDYNKKLISASFCKIIVFSRHQRNGQATLDETTKAVAELCQIFESKEGEVIQTGLHFPLAIYDAQFNLWSVDQLSFFSSAVIGVAEAVTRREANSLSRCP